MFLSFLGNMANVIQVPFGYLLSWLYQLFGDYGLTLIVFAIILKIILFPVTAKSKKSTMKMSRLTPRLQELQKKYAGDQTKLNEATQALYREEGVSMGGGCLWSFVPLMILLPLYTVVRHPITYMLHENDAVIWVIQQVTGAEGAYAQMIAASRILEYKEEILAALAKAGLEVSNPATLEGLKFTCLGVDLSAVPSFNVFKWEVWDWAHIGLFLLPILSAGGQLLSMFISQKMNNSLITDEKGLEDKETAKNSQANQNSKMMLYMMPLMSLWIGYTAIPGALSLYWFVQGLASTAMDVYLTKKYRKIYDAEDAARLEKAMAAEAVEAEKERIRAERRAANPAGITTNTSKKKLQQQQQREQEAAKAAAAREYAAKKGIEVEEKAAPSAMSGIPSRPYCKGRNYDPNRYASQNTEE